MAQMILPSIYHRAIDGFVLAQAREKAGMTQEELGAAIAVEMRRATPFSHQYIQQLERHGIWEIKHDVAAALQKVLDCK